MKKILKYILFSILGILGLFLLITIVVGVSESSKLSEEEEIYNEVTKNIEEEISDERKKEIQDSILSAIEDNKLLKKENYDKAIQSLKSFRKKEDEFEDVKFYSDKRTPYYANVNFIYPYISNSNNNYYLRLKLQYASDNWLFINKATFLIDGLTFEVRGNFKRDNNSTIWEWLDMKVGDDEKVILELLANSKKAKVRYTGNKYYKDRTITSKEKSIIRKTLKVYDGLTYN